MRPGDRKVPAQKAAAGTDISILEGISPLGLEPVVLFHPLFLFYFNKLLYTIVYSFYSLAFK